MIVGNKVDLYYEKGHYFNRNDDSLYRGSLANADGTYNGFLGKVGGALDKLESKTTGNELVDVVAKSKYNITLKRGSINKLAGRYIYFNPGDKTAGLDVNGKSGRPSFLGLDYELAHAFDRFADGSLGYDNKGGS